MDAHAGLGAGVDVEEVDFGGTGAGGGDHPFAETELHLAWGEVGDHDHESSDEFRGIVGGFDTSEDGSTFIAAEAEGKFEELLGFGDIFGGEDARDAEVDFGEVIDGAGGGEWFGGEVVG